MLNGLKAIRKNRKLRFYSSLLFLIWSLSPHYGFLVHQHLGGNHAHFHKEFSKTDIALANHIFETLEGSPSEKVSGDSTSSQSQSNVRSLNISSEKSFQDPNKINFKHAHNWSDPNLESLAFDLFWDPDLYFSIDKVEYSYSTPSLRQILLLLPRGPPIFQSA